MKTDYVFGDKVKVLKQTDAVNFTDKVNTGDIGFVLNSDSSETYPVEVQFVGHTECFRFNEIKFLNSNIENDE